MSMYKKSIFFAITALKHFVAGKLWKKCFEKFFFPVSIMAWKGTLPANVLKMPLPGQRLTSS